MTILTPFSHPSSSASLAPRNATTSSGASKSESPGTIFGWIWLAICTFWIWVPITLFILAFPYLFIRCLYRVTLGKPVGRRRARRRQEQRVRGDVVELLVRRGEVRRKWAREELLMARKEGRVGVGVGYGDDVGAGADLECGDLTQIPPNPQNRKGSIHSLPAELRLQIYSDLDVGTALALAQTSRFFYHDNPIAAIDKEQRATYIYHAETFPKNKDRLACFGCLRLRLQGDFAVGKRTGEFAHFGVMESERVCEECEVQRNGFLWDKLRGTVRGVRAWVVRKSHRWI